MWLPTPVYESLPCTYIIGGALFVSGALYLGSGVPVTPLYLALGVFSILSGIWVLVKRKEARAVNSNTTSEDTIK
jgi:membrane protein implicated in regulation of membrane protease activity